MFIDESRALEEGRLIAFVVKCLHHTTVKRCNNYRLVRGSKNSYGSSNVLRVVLISLYTLFISLLFIKEERKNNLGTRKVLIYACLFRLHFFLSCFNITLKPRGQT